MNVNVKVNLVCTWIIKHVRDGKVIWQLEKENFIPIEGGKAVLETIYRGRGSVYFTETNFYVGLYKGSVSKSTTLAIIPNEPSGNGYSRQLCERSTVGWPTIEEDAGYWRIISKELTFAASGGNIGPVGGAFLCTASSGGAGTLLNIVAMGIERTIIAGDQAIVQIKIKAK